MDKQGGLFEYLGPGKSFALGIIFTLLLLFSVGFFILLFGVGFSTNNKVDKAAADFNKTATTTANTAGANQPAQPINLKEVSAQDHIFGDLNSAKLVLVEYSDIDCPFCQRFHPTMHQVLKDYAGQVAWVYRHFPLDSLHPEARKKAEATECVAALSDNDTFWKYLDKLYTETDDDLSGFAVALGVDKKQFDDCLANGTYKDTVESFYQDAVAAGGRGTPYTVVLTRDGQKIPISGALPIEQIKSTLDPLLK
jgi:protein-disulfide isomerase